jgi:hypothetical protein
MNDQTTRGLGLALLLGLLTGPASADPYFGGASGRVDAQGWSNATMVYLDEEGTAEKYFFGIELGRHLKLEVDKVNFGTLSEGVPHYRRLDGLSYSVLFESGVASRTHAFLRFGRFDWDSVENGPFSVITRDGNDGLWGVGLTYELTRGISLRAEWERYEMGQIRADMPSLGIIIEL